MGAYRNIIFSTGINDIKDYDNNMQEDDLTHLQETLELHDLKITPESQYSNYDYFKDIMVFVRDELKVKVPAKQVTQDDMVVNDGMIDYNGYKLNIYMPIGKDYIGSAIYKGDKLIHHYKAQTPQGLTNKIKERYSSN